MDFLGTFQHLLPRSPMWRLSSGKSLRKLFEGLGQSLGDAQEQSDKLWANIDPQTTDELAAWEGQFGLWGTGTTQNRRDSLDAMWAETGGQSPTYIQEQVRAAGFNVYLHQWWTSDAPLRQAQCNDTGIQCGESAAKCVLDLYTRFAKNPFDYTTAPLFGIAQCNDTDIACGEANAICSATLRNDPGYIVNITLTDETVPPIPTDVGKWRYFLYWGAATFPNRAEVPAARELEFKRLILKLCPARDWLVLLVDFV